MESKICILAAGTGSRLKPYTDYFNKVLLPYKGKPVLDNILDQLPYEYQIVLVVGHKAQQLIEYAKLSYGNRVEIVEVDDITIGPGYSLLQAKEHLQCPFYLVCGDCIFEPEASLPTLEFDWLGTSLLNESTRDYFTVATQETKSGRLEIVDTRNKSVDGYPDAFIGIAGIKNYQIFWKLLEQGKNKYSHLGWELVSAWSSCTLYPQPIEAIPMRWIDQGTTLQFLEHNSTEYAKDPKYINELTYIHENEFGLDIVTKITDSKEKNLRRVVRGEELSWNPKTGEYLIPEYYSHGEFYSSYFFEEGCNLYEDDELDFGDFLDWLKRNFIDCSNKFLHIDHNELNDFYYLKTLDRLRLLPDSKERTQIAHNLRDEFWEHGRVANIFHGDLNFANIIKSTEKYRSRGTYITIDWRDCFTNNLIHQGDLYYDLAKLYAGFIYPLGQVELKVDLQEIRKDFDGFVVKEDLDLRRIQRLAGLVYANIAPLYLSETTRNRFLGLAEEYTA